MSFRAALLVAVGVSMAATQAAGPSPTPVPLVPNWKTVTIKEAHCKVAMPAKMNFRKVERLEQPEGRGFFGAGGVMTDDPKKMGMYLVIYGVTTQFDGSPKDLRRFVRFLSDKVDGMVRKMFSDSFTLGEKKPVAVKGGTGLEYVYETHPSPFSVRMRKIVLSDRAYFLIGIGREGDVTDFFESLEPLPVKS